MKYLIIAPGPSLNKEDIAYANKLDFNTYIYINGSFNYMDSNNNDSIFYSSDPKFIRHYAEELRSKKFREILCPFDTGGIADTIPYEDGEGFGVYPLQLGNNSGYAAIALAILRGAKEIYLLGFDMGPLNNQYHFFGDYPTELHKLSPYKRFIDLFERSKKDLDMLNISVVNCTLNSQMKTFPIKNIREIL